MRSAIFVHRGLAEWAA